MPNYNVYIPNSYSKRLEELRLEDESIGQCAKRLLLSLLSESESESEISHSLDTLEDFERRLEATEKKLDESSLVPDELRNIKIRLEFLEAREAACQSSTINHQPPQPLQPTGTSTAAGLTHSQLAKKLGVNKSTTTRWVKRGTSPDGGWGWDGNYWKPTQN